ncbi:MAG: hypothetical protein JWP69_1283 [Flaviaesturariibacter sp.]|nr:hypothetical protein [Flaviaesturariibacter sp.]
MHLLKAHPILFVLLFLVGTTSLSAQQITGVWKGRIDKKKVELKIIQNGDSLTGTAYYFETANNYKRYSIKGYFDARDNSVVWWDDQLLDEKGRLLFGKTEPQLSVADFNCPGGGKMYLEGKATPKENTESSKSPVDLTKASGPNFPDEWDYVIDNYTIGSNDPDIIDSIELVALGPKPAAPPTEKPEPVLVRNRRPSMVSIPPMPAPKRKAEPVKEPQPEVAVVKPQTIEEKFTTRQKTFVMDIPVTGDSIELHFYDNAEVDGDSISLFLNDRLLFQHIRLTDKPYIIKLSTKDLSADNELTMVAENLGAIPPNTSYMVATVEGKRYSAKLASTENSSAVIRLKKTSP